MRIVNLTPHAICVTLPSAGLEQVVLPRGEQIARVEMFHRLVGRIEGIPIYRTQAGSGVSGLPDPEPNTFFVVSRVVAEALPERNDLLIPGIAVRDTGGAIVGCKGLTSISRDYPVLEGVESWRSNDL